MWLVDIAACRRAILLWGRRSNALDRRTLNRLRQVKHTRQRDERQVVHCALRFVLERHLGPKVRGLPFLYSETGKPSLPGTKLSFSLSHTEGMGLIAVCRSAAIGVDIEPRTRAIQMSSARQEAITAYASRCSCISETELLSSPMPFLKSWVRLEAYAKAAGTGLAPLLKDAMAKAGIATSGASGAFGSAGPPKMKCFGIDAGHRYLAAVVIHCNTPPKIYRLPASTSKLTALLPG